jgi:hypothetical protein
MQEQIVELLHGKDLTPGMPRQLTEALGEVKLTEQLDDYIENPAELAAPPTTIGYGQIEAEISTRCDSGCDSKCVDRIRSIDRRHRKRPVDDGGL